MELAQCARERCGADRKRVGFCTSKSCRRSDAATDAGSHISGKVLSHEADTNEAGHKFLGSTAIIDLRLLDIDDMAIIDSLELPPLPLLRYLSARGESFAGHVMSYNPVHSYLVKFEQLIKQRNNECGVIPRYPIPSRMTLAMMLAPCTAM